MIRTSWQESPIWLAAGWTMFQFLWIGLLSGMLGLVLRWMLRQAAPQVRYVVALGLLLTTSLIPVVLFFTAVWPLSPPVAHGDPSVRSSSFKTSEIGSPVALPIPVSGTTSDPQLSPQQRASSLLSPRLEWSSIVVRQFLIVRNLACRMLPWLWLAGTPSLLLMLAFGVTGADRLRRSGRVLTDGEIVVACERLKKVLSIGRHVAIVVCDRVAAPILTGIVRPAILIPSSLLTGLSQEQIEMVLLHELSHVRRWDNLVNLVQRVIEAGLFFQPVVWWLSNWVRLEREMCCDHCVVAHTDRPQVYAETLAALALPGITPRHAAAAMADCHLVTRIRHILKLEDETMYVSQKFVLALVGLLIATGYFSASFGQSNGPGGTTAPNRDAELVTEIPVNVEATIGEPRPEFKVLWLQTGLDQTAELQKIEVANEGGIVNPVDARQLLLFHNPAANEARLSFVVGAMTDSKWAAQQATGVPNSPEGPNNPGTAWCPATADGQEEWLELSYAEPIEPLALVVYECSKPGALTRVVAFDAEGNELNAWSGKDPSPQESGDGSAISVVPLKLKKIKIVRVRLYLDSVQVPGWNEIDAVGILDVRGNIHWATAATASSTWVDTAGAQSTIQMVPMADKVIEARIPTQVAGPTSPYPQTNIVARIRTQDAPLSQAHVLRSNAVLDYNIIQGPAGAQNGQNQVDVTELPAGAQNRRNPANVSQFEERIKSLESELARLREALKQMKSGN